MSKTTPAPNLVNFEELRLTGCRTVEIDVRGRKVRVTENLEEDSTVDREIGRARMTALSGSKAANALMALPEEETEERKAKQAELVRATAAMDQLDMAVVFDRRRIVCQRISSKFVEWNVVGSDGNPLPLGFDALYDCPLNTGILEAIYDAVQAEPLVGN